MKFIDLEHKLFYEQKLKEIGKSDAYSRALIYTLGICETTRKHFVDIFDIKEGLINRNSLQEAYQTSTSIKVTRMAFNLWNNNIYDSDESYNIKAFITSRNFFLHVSNTKLCN